MDTRSGKDADVDAPASGVAQRLVEVVAGAGAHRREVLLVESLLVITVQIWQERPIHRSEVDCGLGFRGETDEYILGILHAASAAEILKADGYRFDEGRAGSSASGFTHKRLFPPRWASQRDGARVGPDAPGTW